MNNELKNRDGSIDKVVITSEDNYKINLNKQYKLVGYTGNRTVDTLKSSILGMNVGINSYGFVSTTIIATLLAIGAIAVMYLSFRV